MSKAHRYSFIFLLVFLVLNLQALAEESPLKKQFDVRYQQLTAQDKAAKNKQQLNAILLRTKKLLIANNAQIDLMKLDIAATTGDAQEQAIDKLLALGFAHERILIDGIQQLDALSKGKLSTRLSQIESNPVIQVVTTEQKSNSALNKDVSVTIEAEDITESGLP